MKPFFNSLSLLCQWQDLNQDESGFCTNVVPRHTVEYLKGKKHWNKLAHFEEKKSQFFPKKFNRFSEFLSKRVYF